MLTLHARCQPRRGRGVARRTLPAPPGMVIAGSGPAQLAESGESERCDAWDLAACDGRERLWQHFSGIQSADRVRRGLSRTVLTTFTNVPPCVRLEHHGAGSERRSIHQFGFDSKRTPGVKRSERVPAGQRQRRGQRASAEPATVTLLGLGLAALGARARRRR